MSCYARFGIGSVVLLLVTVMPDAVAFAQLDISSELTMIGPCRLLDTSVTGQGPGFLANETRKIDVRGQCGIPNEATGIAVNLVVFNAPGAGAVRAYRTDAPQAAPPALYFDSGARVSNMVISALSQNPFLNEDLSVRAVFGGAPEGARLRVVLDVMGYLAPRRPSETSPR
jgi:hypothetical protein